MRGAVLLVILALSASPGMWAPQALAQDIKNPSLQIQEVAHTLV